MIAPKQAPESAISGTDAKRTPNEGFDVYNPMSSRRLTDAVLSPLDFRAKHNSTNVARKK